MAKETKDKNFTVLLTDEDGVTVRDLAVRSNMKVSEYLRTLVAEAIRNKYYYVPAPPIRKSLLDES